MGVKQRSQYPALFGTKKKALQYKLNPILISFYSGAFVKQKCMGYSLLLQEKILILADSQSVLQSITRYRKTFTNHWLIYDIIKMISEIEKVGKEIQFCHILTHLGIDLDYVDKLARSSYNFQNITKTNIYYLDLLPRSRKNKGLLK